MDYLEEVAQWRYIGEREREPLWRNIGDRGHVEALEIRCTVSFYWKKGHTGCTLERGDRIMVKVRILERVFMEEV